MESMYSVKLLQQVTTDFELHTETDGADMCLLFTDVDGRHEVDYKVNNYLPVVNSIGICIPYAAGTVDDQCYVHLTR